MVVISRERELELLFKAFQDCAGSSPASFFYERNCDELHCILSMKW